MRHHLIIALVITGIWAMTTTPKAHSQETDDVKAEHGQIGNAEEKSTLHTNHPDAQWFPDAGLGLFLHWGISSVNAMNISWPMIPGRPLAKISISDPDEIARIIREQDFELKGTKPTITPLEYWEMAKTFNPDNYHPEIWLQKAKDAGFTYVVLTAKHHEGFALWPTKYGDFNTATYGDGKDLIKTYVDACRKVGLKVGLYYSGPDWYFDKDYMNFFYYKVRRKNPEFPELGPDLKPRTKKHTKQEIQQHQKAYAKMVRGQILELLTNYGTIDVLWFDGKPPLPNARNLVTQNEIRKLQPGIVINPRFHGQGDYKTFERHLPENRPIEDKGWAEFCNPWNGNWPYVKRPYKELNLVLDDLVRSRSMGINYLLGIGPMANGDLAPEAYENIDKLGQWMKRHGESVYATERLIHQEEASVPATAKGDCRYLYIIPKKIQMNGAAEITLAGLKKKPDSVTLLSTQHPISYTYDHGVLRFELAPEELRQIDVVKVVLKAK